MSAGHIFLNAKIQTRSASKNYFDGLPSRHYQTFSLMQMVGTGTRVLNFLIDTLIIAALSRALYTWYSFQVMYWHYPFIQPYIFLAVVLVLYYFLFESIFNRSPAKWLTLTKVVTKNNGKPNILQILIRSLIRLIPIDCFFIPFLDGQTLHDYLSKTYIVEV